MNTTDNSNAILKKCLSNSYEGKKSHKWKTENKQKKNKMANLVPNISISTLNLNGLNIPVKRPWQSGLKNIIQMYIIYKKLASNITVHTSWK